MGWRQLEVRRKTHDHGLSLVVLNDLQHTSHADSVHESMVNRQNDILKPGVSLKALDGQSEPLALINVNMP